MLTLKVSTFGNKSEVQCSGGLLFGTTTDSEPFLLGSFCSNSGVGFFFSLSLLKLCRPKFYKNLGISSYFVHVQ